MFLYLSNHVNQNQNEGAITKKLATRGATGQMDARRLSRIPRLTHLVNFPYSVSLQCETFFSPLLHVDRVRLIRRLATLPPDLYCLVGFAGN